MKNHTFYCASAATLFLPNFNNIYRKIEIQFVFKEDLFLLNTKQPSVFGFM